MPPKKNSKETNIRAWIFEGREITDSSQMPQGSVGFIYKIFNLTTGRYYVGRKTVFSKSKRKLTVAEKKKPENSRKTFITTVKENTSWKNYCGSNLTLKAEVKSGNIVEREILCFCFSKAEMTYQETSHILCGAVLLDPLSYNDWCSAKIYKRFLISS